ncbi:hypothetical protein V5799_013733 [Amblyomma americanum]|uniref:Myb/SANT-like DNA-binding domain-containing protein n=1 Tax=Amblyomma americanum TaxID=6943 RepID=A0AAQ4E547_AMBAM
MATTMSAEPAMPAATSSEQKRVNWPVATTEALIRIWEDNLSPLRSNTRDAKIYSAMADSLNAGLPADEGPYSAKQIRQKLENLNKHYRKLRRSGSCTGSKGIEWQFYWLLHSFLGALPVNDSSLEQESVEVITSSEKLNLTVPASMCIFFTSIVIHHD